MSTIGDRIRNRRKELNLSQDELATRLGYKSKASINKLELGQRNLTQTKIKAIADALETTPAYIMGWEDNKMPAVSDSGHSPEALKFAEQFSDLSPDEWQQVAQYADFLRSRRNDKEQP